MFLPKNSHFLLFLNGHRALPKLELCNRLKNSKKFEFSGKNCLLKKIKKGKSVVNGGVPTPWINLHDLN